MPHNMTDSDLVPRLPRWLVAVITVSLFVAIDRTQLPLFREIAGDWQGYPRLVAWAVFHDAPAILVPLGVAAMLFGPGRASASLGLNRPVLTGLAVGLLGTAILPLGYAAIAAFAPPADPLYEALRGAVLPGLAEEVLFRAFLFGFLFRFAGWGFLPAALVGAVVFGVGHLDQGEDLVEAASIFAITALGAIWFAWLYVEWDYNIWVPAAFHILMNFYWAWFDISDTALGSLWANALRLAVILISVAVTIRHTRRRGGRRVRGRRWRRGDVGDPSEIAGRNSSATVAS